MKQRLVILRHAHRNTDDPARDNGLSDKGREQVEELVQFAQKRFRKEHPVFFSSPKKRCIETITPIAKAFKEKVKIDELLGEQGAQSTSSFENKIDLFLEQWKADGPELTVICSHGDWIPVATQKLTGSEISLKKAGWCEIEYDGRECTVIKVLA